MTKNTFPSHDELKVLGKRILKGLGYSDEEIQEEYRITINPDNSHYIIDIVGIKDNYKIAIECGTCMADKLFQLKSYFNEVIWLAYWFQDIPIDHTKELEYINQITKLKKNREEIVIILKRLIYKIRDFFNLKINLLDLLDSLVELNLLDASDSQEIINNQNHIEKKRILVQQILHKFIKNDD